MDCLVQAGCTVYEMSRREASIPGTTHISVDVSDENQVAEAVSLVVQREGRLDILVNNAGSGISGAAELTSSEDAKRLLDVNLFGMVNASKAVLPIMRDNGGGRIVNLSSVAAALPIPFQLWYSVSKASVNAFTMALHNEVSSFGVSVCAVMPGDIKTGFTNARKKDFSGDDIYGGRIKRSIAVMEKDELNGMAPEKVGKIICYIALKNKVKPLYVIGLKYKTFTMLNRVLPTSLVNRIIGMLYAK